MKKLQELLEEDDEDFELLDNDLCAILALSCGRVSLMDC